LILFVVVDVKSPFRFLQSCLTARREEKRREEKRREEERIQLCCKHRGLESLGKFFLGWRREVSIEFV